LPVQCRFIIVTPRQLRQANVEIYQSEINKKNGTKLAVLVVYYSQLMTVAYGGSLKDAGLDGQVISATGLDKIMERK
jgi:heterodisulfide reductase subunit B